MTGAVISSSSNKLKAPFPYFGGKSLIAPTVWAAFGEPSNYIEPFAGSLATLLCRPYSRLNPQPRETVNDADGLLANFWRSMVHDPESVILAAENPVNECDLHARHVWLVERRDSITNRLMGDPDWCDPKAAGWWVWGICCWIGSGWCSGNGPWASVDGIFSKISHLNDAGRGVNRQLPHLSNAGQGVNRQLPHLSNAGQGDDMTRQRYWLSVLIERLRYVRVACGDWSRVVTNSVLRPSEGYTAVFLDPPYSVGSELYTTGKSDVRNEVRDWCAAHGRDDKLRIILCGYEGEHELPGWTKHEWTTSKGFNRDAGVKPERLWLSPGCLPIDGQLNILKDYSA